MWTDYFSWPEFDLVEVLERTHEKYVDVNHNGQVYNIKLGYLSHYPWRRKFQLNSGYYSYHSANYLFKFLGGDYYENSNL
jgi:hypothetical protein